MSTSDTAPTLTPGSIKALRVDSLPGPYDGSSLFEAELATFGLAATDSWKMCDLLQPLLFGIEHGKGKMHKIVRVEMIWEESTGRRGALLFDSHTDLPTLYLKDAFLGYAGAGSSLGRALLEGVGVPTSLAVEAEGLVPHQDYAIVFSRQKTTIIEGVEIGVPYLAPLRDWEFWRVR